LKQKVIFERARLGFSKHFLSNSFHSSLSISLRKQLFKNIKCRMCQKSVEKVSHIIWMAPKKWKIQHGSKSSYLLFFCFVLWKWHCGSIQRKLSYNNRLILRAYICFVHQKLIASLLRNYHYFKINLNAEKNMLLNEICFKDYNIISKDDFVY